MSSSSRACDGLVDVVLGDEVRGQEAQDRFVRAVEDNVARHHAGVEVFGEVGGVEISRPSMRPSAADFGDGFGVLCLQSCLRAVMK